MARVLGYGGIANTNGLRDFSGKAAAGPEAATTFDQGKLHRLSRMSSFGKLVVLVAPFLTFKVTQ